LAGHDFFYGGQVGGDFFAELSLEASCSQSLTFGDPLENTATYLWDDLNRDSALAVDPVSQMNITAYQLGIESGLNLVENVVDAGLFAGISYSEVTTIWSVPDWIYPWNW
jgi:hypothetical protein